MCVIQKIAKQSLVTFRNNDNSTIAANIQNLHLMVSSVLGARLIKCQQHLYIASVMYYIF